MNKLILTHRYVSTEEVADIFCEIDKADDGEDLEPVRLRALVTALTGDIETAVRILDEANSASVFAATKVALLENAGRCSAARLIYAKLLGPASGLFTANVELGLATGAICQVAEFAKNADKMGLNNLEALPMTLLTSASEMLNEFGIKDATISSILDEVGAVLSANRVFYVGVSPKFEVIDIQGVLRSMLLTYQLPSIPSETAAMYMQFVDRLVSKNIEMPNGLQINFASTTIQ